MGGLQVDDHGPWYYIGYYEDGEGARQVQTRHL